MLATKLYGRKKLKQTQNARIAGAPPPLVDADHRWTALKPMPAPMRPAAVPAAIDCCRQASRPLFCTRALRERRRCACESRQINNKGRPSAPRIGRVALVQELLRGFGREMGAGRFRGMEGGGWLRVRVDLRHLAWIHGAFRRMLSIASSKMSVKPAALISSGPSGPDTSPSYPNATSRLLRSGRRPACARSAGSRGRSWQTRRLNSLIPQTLRQGLKRTRL